VATSTFKVGLHIDFYLRASLTLRPVMDMHKLMERVEEYKRLEDDQLHAKSKSKALVAETKVARVVHPPSTWKRLLPQGTTIEVVSSLNKELIYRIVDKIKNEPYF